LWVVRGVHLKHTRPWLDVIVASSLLIAVLTIHVATRPLRIVHPMTTAACVALLAALAAICCVWWIHGQQRWSLRLAGLVTGLAVIAAALLGTGHRHDPGLCRTIDSTWFHRRGEWRNPRVAACVSGSQVHIRRVARNGVRIYRVGSSARVLHLSAARLPACGRALCRW
jgi:hypothetical protein